MDRREFGLSFTWAALLAWLLVGPCFWLLGVAFPVTIGRHMGVKIEPLADVSWAISISIVASSAFALLVALCRTTISATKLPTWAVLPPAPTVASLAAFWAGQIVIWSLTGNHHGGYRHHGIYVHPHYPSGHPTILPTIPGVIPFTLRPPDYEGRRKWLLVDDSGNQVCTLTHSLTRAPTHPLTHPLTYSLTPLTGRMYTTASPRGGRPAVPPCPSSTPAVDGRHAAASPAPCDAAAPI